MKNSTLLSVLAIVTVLVIGSACRGSGNKLDFNGHELRYTDNVTKADAQKLGEYLLKFGLFKGDPIRVQLDKAGAVHQIRLAVQRGQQKDLELRRALKILATEISVAVFNREATEFYACDDELKSCSLVPMN